MTKHINAEADPVGAAILEGKLPESRRDHWMALMAKNPKKTRRVLAKLEGGLIPSPEDMVLLHEAVSGAMERRTQAAPSGSRASDGPTDYPDGWLRDGEVKGRPGPGPGLITFEDPMGAYGASTTELA
jgi:hypothetical protein